MIERMKHDAALYPRLGYRRIYVYLELCTWSGKAFSSAGIACFGPGGLPNCRFPRSAAGGVFRPRDRVRCRRWGRTRLEAYDFVFDACADGQPLKCLVATDGWTHEALMIDVQDSIHSSRLIKVLSRLANLHGTPRHRGRTMTPSSSAGPFWPGCATGRASRPR